MHRYINFYFPNAYASIVFRGRNRLTSIKKKKKKKKHHARYFALLECPP